MGARSDGTAWLFKNAGVPDVDTLPGGGVAHTMGGWVRRQVDTNDNAGFGMIGEDGNTSHGVFTDSDGETVMAYAAGAGDSDPVGTLVNNVWGRWALTYTAPTPQRFILAR